MNIQELSIPEVLLITPRIYNDDRGFFMETWNQKIFDDRITNIKFVQDNYSRSKKNVLRGLHYQINKPQGKLVRVINGRVFDVAVDLRASSKYFLSWVGVELSDENHQALWIPPGFAHGFYVLSDYADFMYKATDYYSPENERCIKWNDPSISIDWPTDSYFQLNNKDLNGSLITDAEVYV